MNKRLEWLRASNKSVGGTCAQLKLNFNRKELTEIKSWINYILKNTKENDLVGKNYEN